jgi:very-short-patch-repair endonuclease
MRQEVAPESIAAIASRQHGAISIAQLHGAGFSDAAVSRRVRSGHLHRLHRGVYAVGHTAPSTGRRWMAAVLALGENAVLSHRSAAELWGLLAPAQGPVHVSVPGRGGRARRQGICLHRPVSLEAKEMTRRHGIPVTSPVRTLSDLQATVSLAERRRAIRQADVLGLATGSDVPSDGTRSELEHRFLRLCRRHRLPAPAVNMQIESLMVDFCWVEQRLIVETDGYRYHRGRAAFEDDRTRDLKLRALGYEVLRLSYRQVRDESAEVGAVLRGALRS